MDHRDEERERLRAVLREHHLQGIVAETEELLFLLAANIELSAVFLSQDDRTLECSVWAEKSALSAGGACNILRSSDTRKMPKLDNEADALCIHLPE